MSRVVSFDKIWYKISSWNRSSCLWLQNMLQLKIDSFYSQKTNKNNNNEKDTVNENDDEG